MSLNCYRGTLLAICRNWLHKTLGNLLENVNVNVNVNVNDGADVTYMDAPGLPSSHFMMTYR